MAPADLPFTVEVIRSARRTRSVGAQMKGSVLRITVPSWMTRAQEADAVAKMTARFRRSISAERIDLVHARSRAPAWSAWSAARRRRIPFVTTFHGTYGAGNAFKRLYNSVMVRGEPTIATSEFIARHIIETYKVPVDRLRLIPRGIDLEKFSPERVHAHRMLQLQKDWRLPDGVPVILHTDHCAKKLLPWLDGMMEADEAFFKANGTPL